MTSHNYHSEQFASPRSDEYTGGPFRGMENCERNEAGAGIFAAAIATSAIVQVRTDQSSTCGL